MRTYCIMQGNLLNALWWPKWDGHPKEGKHVFCMTDSFFCTVEDSIAL